MTCETEVQTQFELYQRLKKWYLMPPCLTLSIMRYEWVKSPVVYWLPSLKMDNCVLVNSGVDWIFNLGIAARRGGKL